MYFDDIRLNTVIDIPPAVIDRQKMLDFALEYDNIPLHTDEEYAKASPFGALIAPGMMSFMAVWAKYLEVDLWGSELVAGKSSKVEWLAPVYAGDTLTGKATVTALTPRNKYNGTVEITITVKNQHGITVLTNITKAVVKRRTE